MSNNGKYVGGMTLAAQAGLPGDGGSYAAVFDGSTGYVSIPSGIWFSGGDWTTEFWVWSNPGGYLAAYDFGNAGTDDVMHDLRGGGTGYEFVFEGSGLAYQGGTGGTMVASQWNHLVQAYDSTAGTIQFYLNGSTDDGALPIWAPNDVTRNTNAIGKYNALAAWFMDGSLSHFAVYDRALGGTEVANHYSTGFASGSGYKDLIISAAPLAYWRLADASGTVAVDEMSAPPSGPAFRVRSSPWGGW
jgi:hypothetical protein